MSTIRIQIIFKNIVAIGLVTMFFSCTNNSNEVRDLFKVHNLPVGTAKNLVHVYKDSGRISSKLMTPWLNDFSNRKEHPYNEFPKGIKIISFDNNGKDSVTIIGNYGLTYTKTQISEITGNVVITNHTDRSTLYTDQLFWDQNTDYFFSEKKFKWTNPTDTIYGVGFESNKDLSKFLAKKQTGQIVTSEN